MSEFDAQTAGVKTYRSRGGLVSLAVCALIAIFLLGDAVVRAGWASMLLLAPWVLLALWVIYVTTAASFVRTDDEGVSLQNLLRRTAAPWSRVADIDLKWQLVVALDDGRRIECLGAPAKARPRPGAAKVEGRAVPEALVVMTEIRDRWSASDRTGSGDIVRSWDIPALIALGVIAVGAVFALMA